MKGERYSDIQVIECIAYKSKLKKNTQRCSSDKRGGKNPKWHFRDRRKLTAVETKHMGKFKRILTMLKYHIFSLK